MPAFVRHVRIDRCRRGLRSTSRGTTAISEYARGQKKKRPQQREQGIERNTDHPKRQRQEPHEGPENNGQDCQGPAQHQQQAPADDR
jgi:hypothetical protein